MTIAVIVLIIAGVALVWGATQRTSLAAFQPGAAVRSQLPDGPDLLDRIAVALPAVPGARLQEQGNGVLLVSAGPSVQCLSRGAGIFVRVTRDDAGVLLEGRAKVPLNTNTAAALTEFERQVRQAVEGLMAR